MEACTTLVLALEDVVLLNMSTWHQFCAWQDMMVLGYCPSRLLTLQLGINFVHQTEINTEIVQFALINCVTLACTWVSHTHLLMILPKLCPAVPIFFVNIVQSEGGIKLMLNKIPIS